MPIGLADPNHFVADAPQSMVNCSVDLWTELIKGVGTLAPKQAHVRIELKTNKWYKRMRYMWKACSHFTFNKWAQHVIVHIDNSRHLIGEALMPNLRVVVPFAHRCQLSCSH